MTATGQYTEVRIEWLTGVLFGEKTVHFFCNEGNETKLLEWLPLFLSNYGEIVVGVGQVFIKLKK